MMQYFELSVFAGIGNSELLANLHAGDVVKIRMPWNRRNESVLLVHEQTVAAAFPDHCAAVLIEVCYKLLPLHAMSSFR